MINFRLSGTTSSGQGSDRFFGLAGGDRLLRGPVQGFDEPGVAGQFDGLGAGVDAFGEVVGYAQQDLLHPIMLSDLLADIESDSVMA